METSTQGDSHLGESQYPGAHVTGKLRAVHFAFCIGLPVGFSYMKSDPSTDTSVMSQHLHRCDSYSQLGFDSAKASFTNRKLPLATEPERLLPTPASRRVRASLVTLPAGSSELE